MLSVFLTTLTLAWLAAAQTQVNYAIDCGRFPQPCNLKCYAIYRGGALNPVLWDGPHTRQIRDARRVTAGTVPNPCCGNPPAINAPPTCSDPSGAVDVCTSPDEYPYAASANYGNGPGNGPTFIRCTGARENSVEGSNWSAVLSRGFARGGCGNNRGVPAGCLVTIGFDNVDIRSDACINKAGARNDGFYYNYNGAYSLVPRDGNASEPEHNGLQLSEPDPALFIPPEQRRELLLDNGHRIMVPPSNKSWEGETWLMGSEHGDDIVEAKVVRELLGMEKSRHLR